MVPFFKGGVWVFWRVVVATLNIAKNLLTLLLCRILLPWVTMDFFMNHFLAVLCVLAFSFELPILLPPIQRLTIPRPIDTGVIWWNFWHFCILDLQMWLHVHIIGRIFYVVVVVMVHVLNCRWMTLGITISHSNVFGVLKMFLRLSDSRTTLISKILRRRRYLLALNSFLATHFLFFYRFYLIILFYYFWLNNDFDECD